MIIRGTTPTLTFGLPFDAEAIADGYVIIQQNKKPIVEKPVDACECDGMELSVTLTQKETLDLSCCFKAEISLVVKTHGDERLESDTFVKTVRDTAKDGVI